MGELANFEHFNVRYEENARVLLEKIGEPDEML